MEVNIFLPLEFVTASIGLPLTIGLYGVLIFMDNSAPYDVS
jgi:hypothetical protein